jgi:4-amino-4-deoxy-L-arabinose transferase-like glycosyltransferase
MPPGRRHIDLIFLVIGLAALLLRLHLATTADYIHDEENTHIPLSETISFEPGHLNLPIRGENHPALTAYVVKASGALFGTTPLGYRSLHLLLGLGTIVLIFGLTSQWYGPVAGRWAAALLAFNEYYLSLSARATSHAPHLFLFVAAIYAFSRFLATQRAGYLYAAGASIGVAFYCKEHSALLLPVFFAVLLQARYRHWLRGPHPYLACVVFALAIGPDLYWNLTTPPGSKQVDYSDQVANQATYSSHLKRLGGVGFSWYPSMFYGRSVVQSVHLRLTGRELRDETEEYNAINPAIGVLLLGAILVTTFRPPRREHVRTFLLTMFWGWFLFFTLIKKGDPPGRLDPVSWIWVDVTMFPAIVLAGTCLAAATGKWRFGSWVLAGGALLYAVAVTVGWVA